MESRYKNAQAFSTQLPIKPECVLLEGMFLINITPLGSHKTMSDYGRFLFKRFIQMHFIRGCLEVHVIFDNPTSQPNTPKHFEHKRRDKCASVSNEHYCDPVTNTMKIPKKWRENMLNCRECKRSLVKYLTQYFLNYAHMYMHNNQTLYVAGGFASPITDTAWYVSVKEGKVIKQPLPTYTCNAAETDTRLWLHIKNSACKSFLVLSPDTDTYHIGLSLQQPNKQIFIQLSPINSREVKFLNMTALCTALINDPDLVHIEQSNIPQVMQTIFVCSGCDYISFFSHIGKASFLRYFFQYANFITGKVTPSKGTLADVALQDNSYQKGFLAFLRLVGTVYYKKHAISFGLPSPASHFATFHGESTLQQHKDWIMDIRQTVADRTTYDNQMIPSTEALHFHWKRTCWVLSMWSQANKNTMTPDKYGWKMSNSGLEVIWDTPENMKAVQDRVTLLLKGCKCVSGCKTRRCHCRRTNTQCTEGCECIHCQNIQALEEHQQAELANKYNKTQLQEISLEEDLLSTTMPDCDDADELIDWIFGTVEPTMDCTLNINVDSSSED